MSVNLGELATNFNMNQVEQNRFSGHPQHYVKKLTVKFIEEPLPNGACYQ